MDKEIEQESFQQEGRVEESSDEDELREQYLTDLHWRPRRDASQSTEPSRKEAKNVKLTRPQVDISSPSSIFVQGPAFDPSSFTNLTTSQVNQFVPYLWLMLLSNSGR